MKKIPVILDTDIGVDVDDVWALAMLLKCPQLDVKLITTATGDTEYAARIVARLLLIAGRTDIPIGIGIPLQRTPKPHASWVQDFPLDAYSGRVIHDGVGAIVDTIMGSNETITLISIGPLTNIAAALQRQPAITGKSRFIGMHGSVRKGYADSDTPAAEYNVAQFPQAAQKVFSTPWDITITPLDSCGIITLQRENFAALQRSDDPLLRAVLDNHHLWMQGFGKKLYPQLDAQSGSSTLFDTVAIYLAFSENLLEMETHRLRVTDKGETVIDSAGQSIRCAMGWKDLEAFEALLVDVLTGPFDT